MRPLNQLLLSDLRRMWRQCVAISVLLACGIATFVMSNSAMRSIEKSRTRYYSDYHFGDIFAGLTRAPNKLASRFAEIPGVQRVETRIVRSVILDVPNMVEPATCQLVSVERDPASSLNAVALLRGRLPNPEGRSEVLASEPFADAHGFRPGDKLDVIMGGRKEQMHIVGVAMSPEFVYAVQPGMLLTDNRRFGVLWMPRRQMEAAFNMEGAFNDVAITLQTNAIEKDVIHHVDRLTEPFGGAGAYNRSDQASHHRVADELQQMRNLAFVTPTIFLAVSTFLFNIVLSRLVNHQKEQIATLRAFGYGSGAIGFYYVKFLLVLVTAGAVVGCLAAVPLSWWMTSKYVRFFRFPIIVNDFALVEAIFATFVGFVAAAAGSYFAIRRAMQLPPAVAMRPEPPPSFRQSILERIGLKYLISPLGRMIVRRLHGNRRATILSVLGMALGLAVVVLGSFFEDTIDYVMDTQFERAQRQDVMLTFYEARSISAMHDAEHLPGVISAEPFRAVAVRLRHGTRDHRLGIMGLNESPQLYRVLDESEKPIKLPPQGGLTISKKLAEILEISTGEDLMVEVLEGNRGTYQMKVESIFSDFTDPGAYLNRQELHRLLGESERSSGAFLLADPARMDEMYAKVKQTPAVAGVLDKNAAMKNFKAEIADNTSFMRILNAIFASIISFGVIYNCALITLAERSRDMATMRIMGYRRREVSYILLGELAIITLLAIPVGLPIGYGFAYLTTLALDTETHRFPLVVSRATFAYATCVILAAAVASSLYVRRKLNNLDLIAVMKVKE
ncbi:MAG: FtsX-like permease family protein [Planctomycetota bacterium]